MSVFLDKPDFPYCKGCGHHLIARNTVRALENLERDPLDVVLVTDIGCHGIVDASFATHTIHGLHGRSVALGSGIALGLPAGKDVIVFVGDGGATIGLQHLLEAARLNVDVTVIVHNNMLYGMTGGQPSGLTPCGLRTVITRDGSPYPPHDLCQLVHDAGAPYARRVLGIGDFSSALEEALAVEGFALVEVLELCTSYGLKMNPSLRLRELATRTGHAPGRWTGDDREALRLAPRLTRPSLLEEGEINRVTVQYRAALKGQFGLVLEGSAGEGVQRAAELFVLAALASGLHATKKGSYPVTVGVGFSTAEVVVSRDPISYHGISKPDYCVITSEAGLIHNLSRIGNMSRGAVWLDQSLEPPDTGADLHVCDFRGRAGPRNAALLGLLTFSRETGVIPTEAVVAMVRESSISAHVPHDLLDPFDRSTARP